MSYFTNYANRVKGSIGNDIKQNTINTIQSQFKESPSYVEVEWNGILTGVRLQAEDKPEHKSVLFEPPFEVNLGDVCKIKDLYWLVTEAFQSDVFPKANIKLCNSLFPIQSNKTRDLLRDENGELVLDEYDEPIIVETEGTIVQIPCIVENKYRVNDNTEQLWLPENEILVTLPYHTDISVGGKFDMYGEIYEITNIDRTKVINSVGIIILRAKKEVRS